MYQRSGVTSAKYLKKKRRKMLLRGGLIVLCVALFIFISIQLATFDAFRIRTVVVEGATVVSEEDIQAVAESLLKGNYVYFYPRRNIWLYPRQTIRNTILSGFNRIENVTISINSEHDMKVMITERKPAGLWCGDDIDNERAACSYLDNNSFVFEPAPDFSNNVYLKFYGPFTYNDKHIYLPQKDFDNVRTFAENVKHIGLDVIGVGHRNDMYTLYIQNPLHLEASSTPLYGVIYFSEDQSFEKTFENLTAFVKEYSKNNAGTLPPVLYIDLRYGNNIVYKFREN